MADPTNSATRQHWVWVTGPEYYANEDGSDREDLDPAVAPDAGGWWTCHRNTRRGDLVLLYRTRPRSDLKYLILAESDAYSIADDEDAWDRGWDYGCDYRFLYKFREPLTLEDLRGDPYLEEWGALRANFRQRVYRIRMSIWKRLVIRITEREPTARRPLTNGPLPPDDGFPNEDVIENWIASDPSILRRFGYHLDIVERQRVCEGHGGRIDLLGYDRRSKRYVVIELKNVRATLNTVGQIASYMGWARERISGGRVVEGLVIARGFDTRFRAAASMNKWIKSVELADLPLG
jgi:hypothetical protein